MKQLRPDQQKLKHDIYAGWNDGAQNVLAVAPTGFGKSVVVSDATLDGERDKLQQAIIAHRKELVGQMSMHMADTGIMHRIIAPKNVISQIVAKHREDFGRSFHNPTARCSVAGVDTLIARKQELSDWASKVDRWIIDEAHHVLRSNKWGKAAEMFSRARGLGVTASPTRGDGQGLGRHADGVFDVMFLAPRMRELIQMGALCDYEIALPESDFRIDDDAITDSGDYSPKRMREASERSRIVGDIVKEYIKHAYGKRGICFATDVATAGKIAAQFNAFGIPAAAISAETPDIVRDNYVKRFRRGEFWMLVNVDLFGEGFDVPAVEVVIMARPTASLGVYLQQFGRALRTLPGKLYGLVIDHVGNVKRHKYPDKHHIWTLDRREKRAKAVKDPEEIDLIGCKECSRPYPRVLSCCPRCGAAQPVPAPGSRTPEAVDGDLILLDRDKLAAMRAATALPLPADVALRAGYVAGPAAAAGAAARAIEKHAAQRRLSDAIAQWAAIQRSIGRDDQQSYRRFYLTAGMDVLTSLSADRTAAEYIKTAEMVEQWWRQ